MSKEKSPNLYGLRRFANTYLQKVGEVSFLLWKNQMTVVGIHVGFGLL